MANQRIDYSTQLKNLPTLVTLPIDYVTGVSNKPTIPTLPIDYITQVANKPTIPTQVNLPFIVSTDYDFAAQSPGGSLIVGSNTITLNPMPSGITANSINKHFLYIPTGTGAAEAVLITGVTATTVTITCGVTHSGAWTIKSASRGIQEALWTAYTTTGRVMIPGGSYTIYGKIFVPSTISLRGCGRQNTYLVMATGFVTRAMEVIGTSGAHGMDLADFTINYTTAGTSQEGIYIQEVSDGDILMVSIINCYNGINGVGVGRVHLLAINMFPTNDAYTFSSDSGSTVQNVSVPTIIGGFISMASSPNGSIVKLNSAIAGLKVIGIESALGKNGITIVASSGTINELDVVDNTFDSLSTLSVNIQLTGTATIGRLNISRNKCSAALNGSGGFLISTNTNGNIRGIMVNLNEILCHSATANALNIQGVLGGDIKLNKINNNVAGGTAILLDGTFNTDLNISNNTAGHGADYSPTNPFDYGVFVNAQAHNRIDIFNNTLVGAVTALANSSTTAGGVRFWNNTGVDNVIPTIASGATIVAPVNSIFKITGVTTITTLTATNGAFIGARKRIIKLDATSITIGGGGNIPGTHTLAQYGGLDLVYDGSNWY